MVFLQLRTLFLNAWSHHHEQEQTFAIHQIDSLNIYTDFYYYTTDNDLGRNETIKNNTIINLNNESSIKFSTTKDLIENFTEFYNYIYTYETDCISLNLNYNKSYYQDGNLKPDESLSFLIKIIPFTELGVNNLGSLIKK